MLDVEIDLEKLQKRFERLPDETLICAVLGLHQVIEENLDGRRRSWKQIEGAGIGELLMRFVPDDVLNRGFDLYFDENRVLPLPDDEPEDDGA